ncbi:uncharacterized protein B0H18DRAFT_1037435 [Fomitopsis serialis]|uniref:uncharacterized protein n=1 Tax=Fomitopsis serialis TaxID=139415 RepID=UPI0020080C3B|nr:uncharacterized protein B0H18DRAFT_1037435 [Neoantrodia serialis]KAH9916707.1 hypothetical protein B0H18DRAFT_1037435 [Neoantrodia serialis]
MLGSPVITPRILSEEALNEVFAPKYKVLCGVDVRQLVTAARDALQLRSTVAPSEVLIHDVGHFNKVFLVRFGQTAVVARVPFNVPAARDPIRLKSQVATLDFLALYRPHIAVPRVIAAAVTNSSTNSAGAPYVISQFLTGTPITYIEWCDNLSSASRDAVVDLLADLWVKITAPVPFNAIGSILHDPSGVVNGMWRIDASGSRRGFRIIPMIPQFPDRYTEVLEPSFERRTGPMNLADFWASKIQEQFRNITSRYPNNDLSVIVKDGLFNEHSLGELWQCAKAVQTIAAIAASLDPLATPHGREPIMALMHADYACWRNVLFSADRTRIEGIVDWDDAVVVPRDLAAVYPEELTHEASWRSDPDDVFAIPPGTLYEDTGLWNTAIQETQQRRRFRELVQRQDPQLAALYTDRRARLRRRVHYLVMYGWCTWLWKQKWVLGEGLDEARALAERRV